MNAETKQDLGSVAKHDIDKEEELIAKKWEITMIREKNKKKREDKKEHIKSDRNWERQEGDKWR